MILQARLDFNFTVWDTPPLSPERDCVDVTVSSTDPPSTVNPLKNVSYNGYHCVKRYNTTIPPDVNYNCTKFSRLIG